ncbi:hypothetical protein [Cupriavidus basilensis]
MKVFEPKIEVRLIKSSRRAEVSTGVATAARYQDLASLDLTPYLSDGAPVRVGKSVREPAGAWSISLVDRMVPKVGESLYALIEPMDMVEFRLAHNPADLDYAGASGGRRYQLPVVMRGFVSSITRSRSMEGGAPNRMIQVSGHDFGKILQIFRIYYLNNSVVGDNIIGELKFFHKYAGMGDAKMMTAAEFVNLVLDKVVNRYIAALTLYADGSGVGSSVVQKLTPEVSIPGTVDPGTVATMNEVSVFQYLSHILDVGVFNELYVDDRQDGVALVVRPNPFMDVRNDPIQNLSAASTANKSDADVAALKAQMDKAQADYEAQNAIANGYMAEAKSQIAAMNAAQESGDATGAALHKQIAETKLADVKAASAVAKPLLERWQALSAQYKALTSTAVVPATFPWGVVEIDSVDVESISESRTDAGVANFYWVTNAVWQQIQNQSMRELAQTGVISDYLLYDYVNCSNGRYGYRKMEVESHMGPDTLRNSDATSASETQTENEKLLGWLTNRRRILAEQNKDNVVFESGSMRVRGNERIKAGSYLAIRRGKARTLYYVTHVAHEFLPYNSFKTTVMYERGTGFIDRAQMAVAPYLAELSPKGAV